MDRGDKQLPEAWRTPAQLEKLTQDLALTEPYIVWVAIHGYLVLALSHPKTTGPSRQLIENFLLLLEGHLAAAGFPEPPSGWRSFAVVDPPPMRRPEPRRGLGRWDPDQSHLETP